MGPSEVHLILASGSPRRRELLGLLGRPFTVHVSGVDETPGEAVEAYVQRVAREKAEAVARQHPGPALIIAADTEVALDGEILGKPRDAAEATTMLKRLRGRAHTVISGLAVLDARSGELRETLCRSAVPMRAYSDAEIDAYVASGDPLDKAGAYAIQHAGFHPVENFEHCYASVMGLPLCHLAGLLRAHGVSLAVDAPTACQELNNYQCPVYADILATV